MGMTELCNTDSSCEVGVDACAERSLHLCGRPMRGDKPSGRIGVAPVAQGVEGEVEGGVQVPRVECTSENENHLSCTEGSVRNNRQGKL